jgi:hypothetical protein
VERVDILESKLKDQQEELDRLRAKVDTGANVFVFVESDAWVSSMLQWNEVTSENFMLSEDKTSIVVLEGGLFAIGVVVNHFPEDDCATGSIDLQKDGGEIQSVATGSTCCQSRKVGSAIGSHRTSSSLMAIVQVEKDAQLSVKRVGTSALVYVKSYLTAVRIGA